MMIYDQAIKIFMRQNNKKRIAYQSLFD